MEGQSTVSGVLYMAGQEHQRLLDRAYCTFSSSNPMHADLFPATRRMEVEVVRMTASILGGARCGTRVGGKGGPALYPRVCEEVGAGGCQSQCGEWKVAGAALAAGWV